MKPYYQDEWVTLFHALCEDVLPSIAAASIDAVICDPPYGTTACAWDTPIAFDFMWRELKRVTKPAAAIVLFGSQPFTSALVMSNPGMFRYSWVWNKEIHANFALAQYQPLKVHEDICVFSQDTHIYKPIKAPGMPNHTRSGGPETVRQFLSSGMKGALSDTSGMKYPRTIIDIPKHPSQLGLHPTQKPLALLEYLILTYTNPGDTVLDFTSGSGTTPAAAKKLGRKCIAIEQELQYVEVTVSRLQQEVFNFEVPA